MGKATTSSYKDFGLSRPGIEPTTFRSRGERSYHQATAAVTIDHENEYGVLLPWPDISIYDLAKGIRLSLFIAQIGFKCNFERLLISAIASAKYIKSGQASPSA